MKNQAKAYVLTLFAVFFWGTSASAFKISLSYVSPFILLFYSSLFSTLALFCILCYQGKLNRLFTTTTRQWIRSAVLGFINPFLFYLVLFKAYSLLPGQIAMAINFSWPLTLSLLSVPILKQKLTVIQIIAVTISFMGAILIATKGQFTEFGAVNGTGLLLIFSSTIIWSLFWLISARDRQDPVIKLFCGFLFGILYLLFFSLLFGGIQLVEMRAILPLAYVGFFEMGITFVLWNTALTLSSSAAKVSNLIYICPFLSLVFLHFIIGEDIHKATLIGLSLIIGSIMLQETVGKKS